MNASNWFAPYKYTFVGVGVCFILITALFTIHTVLSAHHKVELEKQKPSKI